MNGFFRAASLVFLLLYAGAAHAASPADLGDAFALGLLQPLRKPAHALSLLALGLLLGRQHAWPSLAVFAAALAAGLLAIALAVGATPAVDVLLAGAAIAGLLIALAWPLPKVVGWFLAAITGGAIGLDSPPTVTSIALGNAMLVGSGLGACLLLAAAAAVTLLIRRDWQRIGLRIVGSWIAASAVLVLALRIAAGLHQQ